MHSPDLHLTSDTHYCKGDNVKIDPSAAIAPGVVIRAESGSLITVSPGVCIGAGSVIHAHRGDLLIEEGVSIGAGVLVLGQGCIGSNACVGSGATLINPAIAAEQVIAAGALIGDTSRRPENFSSAPPTSDNLAAERPEAASPWDEPPKVNNFHPESPQVDLQSDSPEVNQAKTDGNSNSNPVTPDPTVSDRNDLSAPTSENAASGQGDVTTPASDQSAAPDQNGASPRSPGQSTNFSQVYGRQQIDQLLVALFPHRQPLNSPHSPDSS